MKILMVDDMPANLLSLEALLSGPEYDLKKAKSGEEALQQVQAHHFDLILLDVRMPGQDGFETARLIRERDVSGLTPIMFLTAEANSEKMIAKGFSLGAADYLIKPLAPEILRAKVAQIAARKQSDDAMRQSERNFRSSMEASADGIVIVDSNGMILWANLAASALFGREMSELLESEFGFPAVGGETTELDLQRGNQEPLTVEIRVIDILWERRPARLAYLRDITDRKREAEALTRRNAELERFHRLSIGRELKMIELKKEVNELSKQTGGTPPYDLSFLEKPAETGGGL